MKRLLIGIALFVVLKYDSVSCQVPPVQDWYLQFLFQSMDEATMHDQYVGLPLLWNSKISSDFLIKKLNENSKPDLVRAISLIGMTKDTLMIPVLLNQVNNQDFNISTSALTAISQIGGQKAAKILEEKLLKEKNNKKMVIHIIKKMEYLCSPSSIPIIDNISRNFEVITEKDKEIKTNFNEVIETIILFNEGEKTKKIIISNGLKSRELFGWSVFQIYKSNDNSYLPLLRDIQSSLKEEQNSVFGTSNYRYDLILRLRLWLGDNQFTPEEQAYVAKNPQLWPLEKRYDLIQREIQFLEQNGYNKK